MSKQELQRGRNWYALQTYSGYEDAVRDFLLQRIESLNMQDYIFDVIVPKETQIETRKEEAVEVHKKIFPGYVLVDMIVTDESWYIVRNTPHVTGFIGAGNTPVPITEEEMKRLRRFLDKTGAPKYKADFEEGSIVSIQDGPFAGAEGVVSKVDESKGKVTVMVSMFGRETPVELDFSKVKKV
ncbi:MAG: transcription termination/antitermination protein NusG [Patescibacteria group bacterium]|nr:transcription termination/antitermination protein NusG [Patescibacteria group bacterium]